MPLIATPEGMDITVPYDFQPRWYQSGLWEAMFDLDDPDSLATPIDRAFIVHHRRAGKDVNVFNLAQVKLSQRVGLYVHIFPTLTEGRKVIWEGGNREGRKFLDYVPGHAEWLQGKRDGWITRKRDDHMSIDFANGSRYQVLGADHPDGARGMNVLGAIFSEFMFFKSPEMYTIISPMLKENGGWAIMVSTVNGRNFGYLQYMRAKKSDRWYCDLKTVADTGVVTEAQIQEEREDGMSEEDIQREYYCSFEQSVSGAWYGQLMADARREDRITEVPHDPRFKVTTWWDIGVNDPSAVWFVQEVEGRLHIIDFEWFRGWGLPQIAMMLQGQTVPGNEEIDYSAKKNYVYETHIGPHDINVREWGANFAETRLGTAASLGIEFSVVPKAKDGSEVLDGINAVKNLIPRCYFDEKRTEVGRAGMCDYKAQKLENVFDPEGQQVYTTKPHKDWTNHPADAFRTGAVGRTLFAAETGDTWDADTCPAPKLALM